MVKKEHKVIAIIKELIIRLKMVLYYVILFPLLFILSPLIMLSIDRKLWLNLSGMLAFAKNGLKNYFTIRAATKSLPEAVRTKTNFNWLIKAGEHADRIAYVLKEKWCGEAVALVTEGNMEILIAAPNDSIAYIFATCIAKLDELNLPFIISKEQKQALLAAGEYGIGDIVFGLVQLHSIFPSLVTLDNFKIFLVSGVQIQLAINRLVNLAEEEDDDDKAALVTEENCQTLLNAGKNAMAVVTGLIELHKAHLLTPDNRQTLLAAGSNAPAVAEGLRVIHEADKAELSFRLRSKSKANPVVIFLTAENRQTLLAAGSYAPAVAEGLIVLDKNYSFTKINMLTAENRQTLLAAGINAQAVAQGLRALHEADVLTTINRETVLSAGNKADAVARGLVQLHKATALLLTAQIRETLLDAEKDNVWFVVVGLVHLYNADPVLLTAENQAALLAAGNNAWAVARGLVYLHRAQPVLLTAENRAALVTAGNKAFAVAKEIVAQVSIPHEVKHVGHQGFALSALEPAVLDDKDKVRVFRALKARIEEIVRETGRDCDEIELAIRKKDQTIIIIEGLAVTTNNEAKAIHTALLACYPDGTSIGMGDFVISWDDLQQNAVQRFDEQYAIAWQQLDVAEPVPSHDQVEGVEPAQDMHRARAR